MRLLITLCRRCHNRVHTWRPGWWFQTLDILWRLWRELNTHRPVLLCLPLVVSEAGKVEQGSLFDLAAR